MHELTIADTAIRQDAEGRYCLNDLHRAAVASGANERTKEPGKFFASQQTTDLVAELETTQNLGSSPVSRIEGRNGGTYVVKELVYAYAMWISPAFHLKVIRAYDAMVAKPAGAGECGRVRRGHAPGAVGHSGRTRNGADWSARRDPTMGP